MQQTKRYSVLYLQVETSRNPAKKIDRQQNTTGWRILLYCHIIYQGREKCNRHAITLHYVELALGGNIVAVGQAKRAQLSKCIEIFLQNIYLISKFDR